jgi:predicted RNA-binding protein with PUA-like domain
MKPLRISWRAHKKPNGRLEKTMTKNSPQYWLFKTEPGTWSWEQQKARGPKGEHWNGVRNHLAKKHLMSMHVGDRGFFYHSVDEKRIMGTVEIIREAYPDHTDESGKFVMVDIIAIESFANPVTLAQCKNDPILKDMVLVHNSRLSVQPVTEAEWQHICALGSAQS